MKENIRRFVEFNKDDCLWYVYERYFEGDKEYEISYAPTKEEPM